MAKLFTPLKLRGIEFKNRIFVSPMCQYSAEGGMPNNWHLVNYGSRAVGGAALVMVEATAICPEGRITPWCTGLWSDAHTEAFRPIADFIRSQGSVPGIQIGHAGRKASCDAPWRGGRYLPVGSGGWQTVAPSATPFTLSHGTPQALSPDAIDHVVELFTETAQRSLAAGFEVIEVHCAHGYLLNEFLSPLSNRREDEYGGNLENRCRLPLKVAQTIRDLWPEQWPVFVRISATDWVDGGWDLAQSIQFAKWLKEIGIDLIDCSSGGLVADAKIPAAPGFQTPFAESIRHEAGIATGAVGLITDAHQAEHILVAGQADAVLLARELLRNPYWPLEAARKLGGDVKWPDQYARAKL
ncbi:MAG TPA: NADH:flavin oxidoreductase/NADH oxidase [Novimethylophilus sp.]|jgi:2,4-dienoyl-CoA reductase-like NADH-dependent reductase (Old Yellow Enzyme family)|uniref:NADH:flavin oxidoreductase/NADH oxidase n=1 Tax=Novimethylophilus sp. TaxID=2137426 RepID=UPI002F405AB7